MWEVTEPSLAIVRLHGRNAATWNRKGLTASSQRFDYDYDDGELRELAPRIRDVARRVQNAHVVFNNNYGDQGQRGARTLTTILAQSG
jgi:uncharacterized protein YecE (DUF72 family)